MRVFADSVFEYSMIANAYIYSVDLYNVQHNAVYVCIPMRCIILILDCTQLKKGKKVQEESQSKFGEYLTQNNNNNINQKDVYPQTKNKIPW